MKESIIDIVEKGGTISIPHKTKIDEWYGELKISKLANNEYVIQPYWQKFSNVEDAVNWFLNEGFTSKNFGYIQKRLDSKGIEFSEYDIEEPTDEVRKAFEEEGKIVDEEAKEFNIVIKEMPKVEDALEYVDNMIKNITIYNIVDSLSEFEKEYMPLDPYISMSYLFEQESGNDFRSGINYDNFTIKQYEKIKKDNSSFKHMTLTIKVGEEYKRFDLNF